MSSPIKPLGDRVVAVREEAKTKTASGLYLPETAREKAVVATVQAVGSTVKDIKVGDKILHKQYGFEEIKVNGVEYIIIKEEDVLATV